MEKPVHYPRGMSEPAKSVVQGVCYLYTTCLVVTKQTKYLHLWMRKSVHKSFLQKLLDTTYMLLFVTNSLSM